MSEQHLGSCFFLGSPGALLFLLNRLTGIGPWRKAARPSISLPRANLEALSIKPTHTAPRFLMVHFILSSSAKFPWNVWQDSLMLVYNLKMMGFLTRILPLPFSASMLNFVRVRFIQCYCLDIAGIFSASGDWYSQIEEILRLLKQEPKEGISVSQNLAPSAPP